MEVNLVETLREHGPMTAKELEKKVGGRCYPDAPSELVGWLIQLKAEGFVYQPKKGYWAATKRTVAEIQRGNQIKRLLERCRELQARGYDMSREIADYERQLADYKKQAAA